MIDVPEGFEDCAWVCECRKPDGSTETTFWITQDGAYEMETETERAFPGTVCEVFPIVAY
jgi:hypothetical protein